MDKLLFVIGGLTALLAALVLADNVRNLHSADETPIVTAWVGGWLIVGMGALIRAVGKKI